MEAIQDKFEKNYKYEEWPSSAADAFNTTAQILPLLNQWIARHPKSFAPYLARGNYWLAVARERRGSKWTSMTPKRNFRGMADAHNRSLPDIDRAISYRPRLVTGYRLKIIANYENDQQTKKKILDSALSYCPKCYEIRAVYIQTLTPRWGGSYKAMLAFANESEKVKEPFMRTLKGYVHADFANILMHRRQYRKALKVMNAACRLGDHWRFFFVRGQVYNRLNKMKRAFADFRKARNIAPGNPRVFISRARIYFSMNKFVRTICEIRKSFEIDPQYHRGKRFAWYVRKNIPIRFKYAKLNRHIKTVGNPTELVRIIPMNGSRKELRKTDKICRSKR